MIKVTCDACDASFSAKDELAGRKGKCPSCGEPIVVPSAPAPATQSGAPARAAPAARAAAPSRAAAPVASGSRRAASGGSSSRRSSSTSSRRSGAAHGRPKKGLGSVAVVGLIAIVLAAAAYFLMGGDGDPGLDAFGQGETALSDGKWDVAIAAFERVPAESTLYGLAQEKLTGARDSRDAAKAAETASKSDSLYNNIMSVEKNYVLREAPDGPNYQPYARYLLKRCRDFVQRFPDDPRASALKQYDFKYAKVASLDTPPTEADVDGELTFRCLMPNPNYKLAAAAVAEFAQLNPDQADAVQRLRERMQASSQEYWTRLRHELEKGGDMEPGSENWQRIANRAYRYLQAIEGVPGIAPSQDALALYERATNGG